MDHISIEIQFKRPFNSFPDKSGLEQFGCFFVGGKILKSCSLSSLQSGKEAFGIVAQDCSKIDTVSASFGQFIEKPVDCKYEDLFFLFFHGVSAFTGLYYGAHLHGGDSVLFLSASNPIAIQLAVLWKAQVYCLCQTPFATTSSLEQVLSNHPSGLNVIYDPDFSFLNFTNSNSTNLTNSTNTNSTNSTNTNSTNSTNSTNLTNSTISKLQILTSLSSHGTWITSQASLQLDPPESLVLFVKSAKISWNFPSVWILDPSALGRFQHIAHSLLQYFREGKLKLN